MKAIEVTTIILKFVRLRTIRASIGVHGPGDDKFLPILVRNVSWPIRTPLLLN